MNPYMKQMMNLVSLSQVMIEPFDKYFVGSIHIGAMIVGLAVFRSLLWTIGLLALALIISAIVVLGRMYYKVKRGMRQLDDYQKIVQNVFSYDLKESETAEEKDDESRNIRKS